MHSSVFSSSRPQFLVQRASPPHVYCSQCSQAALLLLHLPCGHPLCSGCRFKLTSFDCPTCGVDITSVLPLYERQCILQRAFPPSRSGPMPPARLQQSPPSSPMRLESSTAPLLPITHHQIDMIARQAVEDAQRISSQRRQFHE